MIVVKIKKVPSTNNTDGIASLEAISVAQTVDPLWLVKTCKGGVKRY